MNNITDQEIEKLSELAFLKELRSSGQDINHPGYGKGLYGVVKGVWKQIFKEGYKATLQNKVSDEPATKQSINWISVKVDFVDMDRTILTRLSGNTFTIPNNKRYEELIDFFHGKDNDDPSTPESTTNWKKVGDKDKFLNEVRGKVSDVSAEEEIA